MAPNDSSRRRAKDRTTGSSSGSGSKDTSAADLTNMKSPQKMCQEGDTVWAEFNFDNDPFPASAAAGATSTAADTKAATLSSRKSSKSVAASESKDDATKSKSSNKSEDRKLSRSKSEDQPSSLSPEKRLGSTKAKIKKSSDEKASQEKDGSSKKLRNKSDSAPTESSSRSRSESPSGAANRRREKAIENGSSVPSAPKRKNLKKEASSRSCDATETPSRRRSVVPIDTLASSRTRAVQRADARKSWREAHVPGSKDGGLSSGSSHRRTLDVDDVMDAKLEDRRMSLLDQSRKGPVRISSRMRNRKDDDESDYGDGDDDDDDFSVMSSASSSSFLVNGGLEAPFPNRRASCAGGYLPTDLSGVNGTTATPTQHRPQGRRASALGTSLDRAQLIYSLKPRDDDDDMDDDKSCTSYTLPNGLAGSSTLATSQFELGRSSSNTRARRMSLSTPLVVPCVNGSNTDLTNTELSRAEKPERKIKKTFSSDILSLSPSKFSTSSKKSSVGKDGKKSKSVDGSEGKKDASEAPSAATTSTTTHGSYDSAVDDMLKNRRLRGARGDAPVAKKVEEKPATTGRRLSLGMLTNKLVNPTSGGGGPNGAGGVRSNEAAMRRPSRI
jgi:hypothetical protein